MGADLCFGETLDYLDREPEKLERIRYVTKKCPQSEDENTLH